MKVNLWEALLSFAIITVCNGCLLSETYNLSLEDSVASEKHNHSSEGRNHRRQENHHLADGKYHRTDENSPASDDVPDDNSHYDVNGRRFTGTNRSDDHSMREDLYKEIHETKLEDLIHFELYGGGVGSKNKSRRVGPISNYPSLLPSFGRVPVPNPGPPYNPLFPLVVIIHDWSSSPRSYFPKLIQKAFIDIKRWNILMVDYESIARNEYHTAVRSTSPLGKQIANYLALLFTMSGGFMENTHLVGLGLGAHIAGYVGRYPFKRGKIGRITGLDPTNDWFVHQLNQTDTDHMQSLGKDDAYHVQVIHTNVGDIGMKEQIGHIDYYANGLHSDIDECYPDSMCSHLKAPKYFVATFYNIDALMVPRCVDMFDLMERRCNGRKARMGLATIRKVGEDGLYFGVVKIF